MRDEKDVVISALLGLLLGLVFWAMYELSVGNTSYRKISSGKMFEMDNKIYKCSEVKGDNDRR